jgi:putative endonuclease
MENAHFTYLLRCADGTLYGGYTTDLEKRLNTHNAGQGAKYTKSRLPVQLFKSVKFTDKSSAMSCEWWIKHKLTRQQKLDLTEQELLDKFLDYQKTRQK